MPEDWPKRATLNEQVQDIERRLETWYARHPDVGDNAARDGLGGETGLDSQDVPETTEVARLEEVVEKQAARIRKLQTLILMRYSSPHWKTFAAWAVLWALAAAVAFAVGYVTGVPG